MKVPPKDDPKGDKAGQLSLRTVIAVLREHDVSVEELVKNRFRLCCGEERRIMILDEKVGGLLIKQLAAHFEIELTTFYTDPITGNPREPKH